MRTPAAQFVRPAAGLLKAGVGACAILGLILATPVLAQQAQPQRPGQAAGMRYLSWSGKPEAPITGRQRSAAPGPASAAAPSTGRRTSPIIPRRPVQTVDAPMSQAQSGLRYPSAGSPYAANGLTPASVWLGADGLRRASPPTSAMPYEAAPQIAAEPSRQLTWPGRTASSSLQRSLRAASDQPSTSPAPVADRTSTSSPALYGSTQRDIAPAQPQYLPQPVRSAPALVPASVSGAVPTYAVSPEALRDAQQAAAAQQAQPQPQSASPNDPMAPRSDAPIFRIARQPQTGGGQTGQMASAQPPANAGPQGADAGRDTARYYSVHRAAGHQPDTTPLPEQVFYDQARMDQARVDLAAPPADQVQRRNADGRVQQIVPNEDPSLP